VKIKPPAKKIIVETFSQSQISGLLKFKKLIYLFCTFSYPSSVGNISSMSNDSPISGRNIDLVDELKKKDLSELRVTKKPDERKHGKMVFSSDGPSPTITPKSEQKDKANEKVRKCTE
jgi:hypothetical protein